jgi:hypothetical protein
MKNGMHELTAEELDPVSGDGLADQVGAGIAFGLGVLTGNVAIESPSCKFGKEPGPRPVPIPYPL